MFDWQRVGDVKNVGRIAAERQQYPNAYLVRYGRQAADPGAEVRVYFYCHWNYRRDCAEVEALTEFRFQARQPKVYRTTVESGIPIDTWADDKALACAKRSATTGFTWDGRGASF